MYEFSRADLALIVSRQGLVEPTSGSILHPTVPMTGATGRRPIAKEAPVRFYPVDDHQQQID